VVLTVGNERKIVMGLKFRFPGWKGSLLNKTLTVILFVVVFGTLGVLGYSVTHPVVSEKFTEFYILGLEGKADSYPALFKLEQGQTAGVSYDGGKTYISDKLGELTLGIINRQQEKTTYSLKVHVDGQPVNVYYDRVRVPLDRIVLQQDEKWEKKIGFAPLHSGKNQKVEFLLYRNNQPSPENSLLLLISAD
jgi:uncharacterized membrane protein